MTRTMALLLCALGISALPCIAQQNAPALPDAPAAPSRTTVPPPYLPPTQKERFKDYLIHTYGPVPIVEAAIRGGIQQVRDNPAGWPQGGQGYADRFGSAMGEIAVRGTTEYVLSELFKEDIRVVPCGCSESILAAALADTFTARKSDDGHRTISIARLLGPVSGGVVANYTWYPADTPRREVGTEIGLNYGFVFLGNLVRESFHH
jgi:hypothetical protein